MNNFKLSLAHHQKLIALIDNEELRLKNLRTNDDIDFSNRIDRELERLIELRRIVKAIPHEFSHYKIADQTRFILQDKGDQSVGIEPTETTLILDRHIDAENFQEVLDSVYSISENDFTGPITAYVYYDFTDNAGKIQESKLKLQIEDFKRQSALSVRFT